MKANMAIRGMGYALGSAIVSNAEAARSLGLPPDWFTKRTGIIERRACDHGETVVSLAAQAVQASLRSAGLPVTALGNETVLLHVQNGFTHLAPPPAILLSHAIGFRSVRALTLDGACTEVINAIEIAALMLSQGCCDRCIISAAANVSPVIDSRDRATAGLFGAGAGAIIVERSSNSSQGIQGLYWMNDIRHWDLAMIPVIDYAKFTDSVEAHFGYFRMKGPRLAKVALRAISQVVDAVLREADWQISEVDHLVTHQPNAKLVDIGARQVRIPMNRVESMVAWTGNLGPASVLVGLANGSQEGRLRTGDKVLLLSFGLGFSCGGAALVL